MSKKLSQRLFGVTFEEGKVYVVKDKTTGYSTPEEKKKGFFKAPQEGVHETHQVGFKEIGDQKGADGMPLGTFLTGFTEDCPIWQSLGVTAERRRELVKFIREFIVEPYESKLGIKGHLQPANSQFWRSYRYTIYSDIVFNLDFVEHRMALYFALLNGNVATQENMTNPALVETPYKIEDYDIARDEAEEMITRKDDVRSYLNDLLKNDFEYLLSIMKYMNLYTVDINPDKDYVKKTFLKILEGIDTRTSTSQMVQVFELAQTIDGKAKIEWNARVKDLRAYNILVIVNKQWLYQGTSLGVTVDDVIYKLSGADTQFDDYIRDEILAKLMEEYSKRRGRRVSVNSDGSTGALAAPDHGEVKTPPIKKPASKKAAPKKTAPKKKAPTKQTQETPSNAE